MSPYDQSVYDAGFKYIPQSRFLLNPFQIPQGGGGGATGPVQPGLPSINMGGGGGGGAAYTGGITGLTTDFQKAIDARQNRLNNPPDKFFGFDTMRDQQLTGADAGFYDTIPQERTLAGNIQNFLTPQSADQIIEEGYTPRANIGILSNILGKFDKFGTLPRADQAFITSQMGYTGPTVFGENTTGGSKDPFGLNTRSAFGNYAERVGKEATKLGEALTKSAAKRGLTFDASQGALVDAAGNVIDEDEYDAAMKDFINKTNLMRTKFSFYREKVKERDDLRQQEEERIAAEKAAKQAAQRKRAEELRDKTTGEIMPGAETGSGGREVATDAGAVAGAQQDISNYESFGEVPFADGGRVYYMDGGLADLVDIYD